MAEKKKGWKDLPIGGLILEAGNAREYETGSWRTFKPILHKDNCINCFFCWIYCPDSSVIVENEDVKGFDLTHCKGCGLCAKECPKDCIEMVLDQG